jgi:hypothetical protein
MKNEKTFLQIAFITLIATIVVHALLLFNNEVSWDSLMMLNAKNYNNTEPFRIAIFNTGRRIVFYFWVFFLKLPKPFLLIKILTFLMIWCSTIIGFYISKFFTKGQEILALVLTVMFQCIPVFFMSHDPISSIYILTETLFFSAILLYLKTYNSNSLTKKITGFFAVAVLLFWSFEIQSFYVFIYAVLFALFVKELSPNPSPKEKGRIQQFVEHVFAFFKQHYFIILFPIFSFWLWNKLFPISGMAKMYGYNQISFSVGNMLYHFGFSCFKLFVMLPFLLGQLAFHNPITTIGSIVVSALSAWCFFKDRNSTIFPINTESSTKGESELRMKFWVIALISLVFFVAAFLPYNMVGKDYGALNRNCRNGLLAGFGVVIFLVLSVQHFIKKEKHQHFIFTVLFVLFAAGSNLSYMYWQAYYVRFQKTEQLFAENLPKIKTDYMVVHEDCKNPMHQYFVYYEYNFMCKEACGSEKYLALDKHSGWDLKIDTFIKNTKLYKPIFMFKDFNNKIDSVTEIHLVSPPNTLFNAEQITWDYWLNNCNAKNYPMDFLIKN